MTSPGKNHRLRDVRYFESVDQPTPGKSFPSYAGSIFNVPKEATSIGQRIGRKCEELGISIGRASHLYLCFTQSVQPGKIQTTGYAMEPWHQFVLCGLESDFNVRSEAEQLSTIVDATFQALHTLAPQFSSVLHTVKRDIEILGESLRITVKYKETSKYKISIEQTVPIHPRPSEVFLRVKQLSTGAERDIKIGEAAFYDQVPSLVDRMAIVKGVLTVHPRNSFHAALVNAMSNPLSQVNLLELFDGVR